MLSITATEGWVLGLLSLPICLWVAYTDLSQMKIRNWAVLALAGVFVVAGAFVIQPLDEYLWRYAHLGIVLAVGFVLNAIRAVGAGDAKFAAAMAPFVASSDWAEVLLIFAVLLPLTWGAHRLLRAIPAVQGLAPGWRSWHVGKEFPMGVTLACTHLAYLGLAATGWGAPA